MVPSRCSALECSADLDSAARDRAAGEPGFTIRSSSSNETINQA